MLKYNNDMEFCCVTVCRRGILLQGILSYTCFKNVGLGEKLISRNQKLLKCVNDERIKEYIGMLEMVNESILFNHTMREIITEHIYWGMVDWTEVKRKTKDNVAGFGWWWLEMEENWTKNDWRKSNLIGNTDVNGICNLLTGRVPEKENNV